MGDFNIFIAATSSVILFIFGLENFSKEVQIEGSNNMKISDFKYRNGVLTLRIS